MDISIISKYICLYPCPEITVCVRPEAGLVFVWADTCDYVVGLQAVQASLWDIGLNFYSEYCLQRNTARPF